MNTDYGYTVYGLRQIKLVKGATVVQFPIAQTAEITPQLDTAELRGDDILWTAIAKLNSVKISLKNGGMPLEALALFLGTSVVTANSGLSNETRTLTLNGGEIASSVALYAKIEGNAGDNLHIKFFNVTISSQKLSVGDAAFADSATELVAVKDSTTGKLMELVANKTSTALP